MYSSEDLEKNYSENMAADEKDRYIRSLIDKINMFELDKRATELAVEEFQTHFDSVSSTHDSLKKEWSPSKQNCVKNVLNARRPRSKQES